MYIERRCSTRYKFAAIAEATNLGKPSAEVSLTRDLSSYGCFIKTAMPFAVGTEVRVRIRHSGAEFTAVGDVTDNVTREGMGIKFIQVAAQAQAVLEKWLNVIKDRADKSASEPASNDDVVPYSRYGQRPIDGW